MSKSECLMKTEIRNSKAFAFAWLCDFVALRPIRTIPAQRRVIKQAEIPNISETTLKPIKTLGFRPKMPKMGSCDLTKSPPLKLIGLTSKIGPDLFRVVKQTGNERSGFFPADNDVHRTTTTRARNRNGTGRWTSASVARRCWNIHVSPRTLTLKPFEALPQM
jgi:hypothetical protein